MANISILAPFILSFEGGWSNHKDDHGGATNMGVTLKTWMSVGYDKDMDGDIDVQDLKLITQDDVVNLVLKPHYWDRMKADNIQSQAIANVVVDWAWMSGVVNVTKRVQRILGVTVDGKFGPKTLGAINSCNDHNLFCSLMTARRDFYQNIVRNDASQSVFLYGWLRRLDNMHYTELVKNNGDYIYF